MRGFVSSFELWSAVAKFYLFQNGDSWSDVLRLHLGNYAPPICATYAPPLPINIWLFHEDAGIKFNVALLLNNHQGSLFVQIINLVWRLPGVRHPSLRWRAFSGAEVGGRSKDTSPYGCVKTEKNGVGKQIRKTHAMKLTDEAMQWYCWLTEGNVAWAMVGHELSSVRKTHSERRGTRFQIFTIVFHTPQLPRSPLNTTSYPRVLRIAILTFRFAKHPSLDLHTLAAPSNELWQKAQALTTYLWRLEWDSREKCIKEITSRLYEQLC